MTGGGFYVVSFVSCSSCFMLKFSGHYVIKLLGVWRAQAPPFLACVHWALSAQAGRTTRRLEPAGHGAKRAELLVSVTSREAASVYEDV